MIECPESLNIYNVLDIKQEWEQVFKEEVQQLNISMSSLEDIDTAGAQFLLAFKKECLKQNIQLALQDWGQEMVTFLNIIGCNELLNDEVK